jgi:PRTRC genetic system protein E
MFQQLVPLLRQRSVLLTVTGLEHDQIRVNVLPKKLAEGENTALTTPMSFTGTAKELDTQLPDAIVSYVSSYLELKNTLDRAKDELAAAAKAAQEEARNKSKAAKKPTFVTPPPNKEEPKVPEPPKPLASSICPPQPRLARSEAMTMAKPKYLPSIIAAGDLISTGPSSGKEALLR